jgi:hypothetical protein
MWVWGPDQTSGDCPCLHRQGWCHISYPLSPPGFRCYQLLSPPPSPFRSALWIQEPYIVTEFKWTLQIILDEFNAETFSSYKKYHNIMFCCLTFSYSSIKVNSNTPNNNWMMHKIYFISFVLLSGMWNASCRVIHFKINISVLEYIVLSS